MDPSGQSDGPNKKCRVQELIQLPESLDDALVQPSISAAPQPPQPADEAQRQLGTLQLGSGDDPSSPRSTAAPIQADEGAHVTLTPAEDDGPGLPTGDGSLSPILGDDALCTASNLADNGMARVGAPVALGGDGALVADVLHAEDGEPAGTGGAAARAPSPFAREGSLEPAASDAGMCVSLDMAAGSSAVDGLSGGEGDTEVASRAANGSAAGVAVAGADEWRDGVYEVFIGGLPPEAREEAVRAELSELAAGEVVSLRLQTTRVGAICKGYGFATYADEASAQRAVRAAAAPGGAYLCGRRVGVHPSRRPFRTVLAAAQQAGGRTPVQRVSVGRGAGEAGDSMNALLDALRSHPDKKAAVAAALQYIQRGAKRAHGTATAGDVLALPSAGKRQATGPLEALAGAPAGDPAASAANDANEPETVGSGSVPASTTEAAAVANGQAGAEATPAAVPAEAGAAIGKIEGGGGGGDEAAATGSAAGGSGAAKKTGGAAPAAAAAAGSAGGVGGKAAMAEGGSAAGSASSGTLGISVDLAAALTSYPKTSNLLESLRNSKGVPKTPLMVLHEYTTKMSYEMSYTETSEGPAGPYRVEAKMQSRDSLQTTIVSATGKARTKKDAKQVAAAACLERLMAGPLALRPQDLLPVPKQPGGAGGGSTARGTRAASDRPGVGPYGLGGTNSSSSGPGPASGRKPPPGRHSGSTPPPPQPYAHPHPHQPPPPHVAHAPGPLGPMYRDTMNRGNVVPMTAAQPPPPPSHSRSGGPRGYADRSGGGSGGGGGRPMEPPPRSGFGGVGSAIGGGGVPAGAVGGSGRDTSGHTFVQPGLMPANASASGGGLYVGNEGRRGHRNSGAADQYGRSYGSSDMPYGSSSAAAAADPSGVGGGGGSMVQLGLARGSGVGVGGGVGGGAQQAGGAYGALYGGKEGPNDMYGGMSSYDMAAGQKRNYSTAMQQQQQQQQQQSVRPSALGSGFQGLGGSHDPIVAMQPGSRGALLTSSGGALGTGFQQQTPSLFGQQQVMPQQQLQPPQHPMFNAAANAAQFSSQQQQLVSQMGLPSDPVFGGGQRFAQAQMQQQPQQPSQPQPQQQQHLGYGQPQQVSQPQQPQGQQSSSLFGLGQTPLTTVGGNGGSSFYGMGQTVQLQPVQPPVPLFPTPTAGSSSVTQTNLYGMPPAPAQPQQQQNLQQVQSFGAAAPYATGGYSGSVGQTAAAPPQMGSLYGSSQPAQLSHLPSEGQQHYTLPAFGGIRPGGGLWS